MPDSAPSALAPEAPALREARADQMREYVSRRAMLLDPAAAKEILTYLVSEHEDDPWYPQGVKTVGSQEHINLDLLPDPVVHRIYDIVARRERQLREHAPAG